MLSEEEHRLATTNGSEGVERRHSRVQTLANGLQVGLARRFAKERSIGDCGVE